MSRTDKTDPYWVSAEFYVPCHFRCNMDGTRYWRGFERRECDLPESPVRHNPQVRRRFPWERTCGWEADWAWNRSSRYVASGPPSWYIDHMWNNAERVRVRDKAILMKAQFNATGEVDYEFQNFQHRHMASWLWD